MLKPLQSTVILIAQVRVMPPWSRASYNCLVESERGRRPLWLVSVLGSAVVPITKEANIDREIFHSDISLTVFLRASLAFLGSKIASRFAPTPKASAAFLA